MPTPRRPKPKPTAAKLRPWRVFVMRARAQISASSTLQAAAEAAAVEEFKIGEEQRKRLIVREQE